MSEPVGADGLTLRDHLLNIERQTGIEDLKLVPIECSEEVKYIYEEYFLSMNTRRTNNGVGPNAISNMEMRAWSELHGITLSAFEVDALDLIETLWIERRYAVIVKKGQQNG